MGLVGDKHLGGYIEGGDPATFFPDLWTWLVQHLGVTSVIDVGCGEGQAIDYFTELGAHCLGIEGLPQEHPLILRHDYTLGPLPGIDQLSFSFDLCWSCEFVEHVEEEYVPNFLSTFALATFVLMTHADPGQPGYHHVNCQPDTYWIERLASIDYELDETLTTATRIYAAANHSPDNHYLRSGLVFRRSDIGGP